MMEPGGISGKRDSKLRICDGIINYNTVINTPSFGLVKNVVFSIYIGRQLSSNGKFQVGIGQVQRHFD